MSNKLEQQELEQNKAEDRTSNHNNNNFSRPASERSSTTRQNEFGLNDLPSRMLGCIANVILIPIISTDDAFPAVIRKIFIAVTAAFGLTGIIIPAAYYSYLAAHPTYNYPVEVYGSENDQRACIIIIAVIYFAFTFSLGVPFYIYLMATKTFTPMMGQLAMMLLVVLGTVNDLSQITFPTQLFAAFMTQFAYATK